MALFIFRRDLRLHDNKGFIAACKTGLPMYGIFILNPEQIDEKKNAYFSHNSVQFMCESLHDLNDQLHDSLLLYHGDNEKVLAEIFKEGSIKEVHFNVDYSGYSQQRDKRIKDLADHYAVKCVMHEDIGLFPIATVKTSGGALYSKFTPFYDKIKTKRVDKPIAQLAPKNLKGTLKNKYTFAISHLSQFYHTNPHILVHGGRTNGLKQLSLIKKTVSKYNSTHDFPALPTTHLSAYLKYGCLSIREVYYRIKEQLSPAAATPLIRQLFWREFYLGISFQNPQIMKGKSQKPAYDHIRWPGTLSHLNKWKTAQTGFPIVDAAMREMNTTGYMHNRCRLIVSGFLIKTLLRSWRDGEKYFAQTLVDYDFSNNNGGWQWSAGSGTDSQPYFRIFNPWMQSKNFDPDGVYIKRWLPELESVPAKDLHQWNIVYEKYKGQVKYPAPIVDYSEQKTKALKMYSSLF